MTPFMTITLLSVGLALMISIIYRVLTKPSEIRKVKDDMRFYKEKMNEANKAGDRAKSKEYANEMLKASQAQMKHSMKPMVATMLIFLLLLGWLHTNFGGVSADLTAEPEARFDYAGADHMISYGIVERDGLDLIQAGVDLNDDGLFSQDETFMQGDVFEYKGAYWRVAPVMEGFFMFTTQKENAVSFEMLVAKMPFDMPFLGYYLSWFWWYIFISIPATIVFRKILGVE